MSLRSFAKMLSCLGLAALAWSALPAASFAQQFGAPVAASCNTCTTGCQWLHCPPAFKYCYEGPPRIHWHCGCPHPICNPCDLPHFGYWETCWSPYPNFPPTYGYCITPPPAAYVNLNPLVHPNLPRTPATLPPTGSFSPPIGVTPPTPSPMPNSPIEEFPQPRRFDNPR